VNIYSNQKTINVIVQELVEIFLLGKAAVRMVMLSFETAKELS